MPLDWYQMQDLFLQGTYSKRVDIVEITGT